MRVWVQIHLCVSFLNCGPCRCDCRWNILVSVVQTTPSIGGKCLSFTFTAASMSNQTFLCLLSLLLFSFLVSIVTHPSSICLGSTFLLLFCVLCQLILCFFSFSPSCVCSTCDHTSGVFVALCVSSLCSYSSGEKGSTAAVISVYVPCLSVLSLYCVFFLFCLLLHVPSFCVYYF